MQFDWMKNRAISNTISLCIWQCIQVYGKFLQWAKIRLLPIWRYSQTIDEHILINSFDYQNRKFIRTLLVIYKNCLRNEENQYKSKAIGAHVGNTCISLQAHSRTYCFFPSFLFEQKEKIEKNDDGEVTTSIATLDVYYTHRENIHKENTESKFCSTETFSSSHIIFFFNSIAYMDTWDNIIELFCWVFELASLSMRFHCFAIVCKKKTVQCV